MQGTWLQERYRLDSELGRGGMGMVYRAHDQLLNRDVAVKLLLDTTPTREGSEEHIRFLREAQAVAQLNHPNIVAIYDAGETITQEGVPLPYIVMELLQGATLRHFQPTGIEEVLLIASQICIALEQAHSNGIIHRDLKPENILLTPSRTVKLMDFGLARLETATQLTVDGTLMGTFSYLAPELIDGHPASVQTDLYALGVVLYELLTGRQPFEGSSLSNLFYHHLFTPIIPPSTYNPDTLPTLDQLVVELLAKTPAKRPNSAQDVWARLQDLAQSTSAMPLTALMPIQPVLHHLAKLGGETEVFSGSWSDKSKPTLLPTPSDIHPVVKAFIVRPATLGAIIQFFQQSTSPIVVGLYGLLGNGKSELANYLANELRHQVPDGVLRLDLSARDLDSALVRLAGFYGQETRMTSISATAEKARFLGQLLVSKKALLILDQADTGADLINCFLATDSQTVTLITTRNVANLTHIVHQIPIKPFTEAQSLAYMQAILGEERVLDNLAEARRLHTAVGGLPLALRLATTLLAEGVAFGEYLELFQDQEKLLGELAELHENFQLTSALEVSYKQLPSSRQQVFEALAVFEGLNFDVAALAAITGESSLKLKASLKTLRDQSLITHLSDDQYEVHPLVRAFALGKLGNRTSMAYHRAADYFATRLAQSNLQAGYRDIDGDWGNILGLLYWGETQGEWEPFLRLVQGLIQPHLGVLGFLDLRGYWSDARRLLDKALMAATILDRTDLRLPLLVAAAGFAVRQSDNTTASDYLNQAEPLLATNPDWASAIHWHVFRARLSQQTDPEQGLVKLVQALAGLQSEAIPLDEKEAWRGYLLSQQSTFYGMLGQFAECEQVAKESLSILPSWPTDAKLVAINNLSILCRQTGRIEEALTYATEGIALATDLHNIQRLISFWNLCAAPLQQTGRLDEALDYINQAIPVSQQIGHVHYESGFLVNRANIDIVRGRWDEAIEALGRALHLAQTHDIHQVEVLAYSNLADVALARAEWSQAADYLAQGLAICAAHGFPDLEVTLLRQQLQVAQGQDQPEQVLQQVDGVLTKAEELQEPIDLGICLRLKGVTLHQQGDLQAVDFLRQSVAALAEQDRVEWARSRVALGCYYEQIGERELAHTEWKAALDVFDRCQAEPDKAFVVDKIGI